LALNETAGVKMSVREKLQDYAPAIQASCAIITALLTLAALVGVKLQIDASAQQQREQSARDIYREYLNLSIARPELADPDYCKLTNGPHQEAYLSYVEYLIYTSEQLLASDPEWESGLSVRLNDHRQQLCQVEDWSPYTQEVQGMMTRFQTKNCKTPFPECPSEGAGTSDQAQEKTGEE
jgi:hypothetical protein